MPCLFAGRYFDKKRLSVAAMAAMAQFDGQIAERQSRVARVGAARAWSGGTLWLQRDGVAMASDFFPFKIAKCWWVNHGKS